MLTRRHIRVKVLQALYAYHNQEKTTLDSQQKFLLSSMEKMYDLYLLMLDLFPAIKTQAENFMEASKNKHLPTADDIKPRRNFVENKVLQMLESNSLLQKLTEKHKINSWQLDNEYPQILFRELRQNETYQNYLNLINPTFNQDRDFIIFLYKEVIAPNEKLYEYLEDKQITWTDDFPIVNTAIVKLFGELKLGTPNHKWVPNLYKNDDDKEFAILLLQKTVAEDEMLMDEIEGKTPNWDRERIAELDLLLIKMAIIEFLYFTSVPVKVTINEYLEIAKEYSTPKSSLFINGLLDKMSKEYASDNKLNKSGRGLQ
jgi:N utilization substance protein B